MLWTASAAERPNVVLIMADDVSWTAFGSYGNEDCKTPVLDRMAEQGIRFTQCYGTPICTPSRVMLMTGKYNFRNYTHFGYMSPDEKTFGNLLQDAGYKTAIAGKWQLNGLYNQKPGWDDHTRPFKAGFDEYCLWQLTKGKKGGAGAGERFWSPPIEHNGTFISSKENAGKYGPDIFVDFICDFMERSVAEDQPFFAYYPMVLVHSPFVPTPDTIGDAPRTQKANKARRGSNEFPAMVNYMDQIVGRILEKTEALGIAENTLIIFTADNGTNTRITTRWNGRKIKGGKGGMTDTGTHVPLIAYWKGHTPKGKVLDDLVDFTDFYPTLAELAGIGLDGSDPFDGTSFLPQIQGLEGTPRDWVLCHYQPYWNKEPGQFVRTAEYKLYADGRFYKPAEDLDEKNDLAHSLKSERQMEIHRRLQSVLETAPPAPTEWGSVNTKEEDRVIYPEWRTL
ncbi:sulfatase-like hydrolase/transferase [Pontiella agarivorans]|uniref:Sulfatase-like hydrolase/transferase n=1 Tax=Pontiella agarivorans TaxID=3038953 RepID=A0ABU5MS39_9BACT|nr:sulfatase-like hydrolase/transferase [Pontiella agarivorans]MDZ8117024.1 sulfatase-like hydrolase/transferase [Pontiella agarivorans]